jgi:hypothetical protein
MYCCGPDSKPPDGRSTAKIKHWVANSHPMKKLLGQALPTQFNCKLVKLIFLTGTLSDLSQWEHHDSRIQIET